MKLKKDFISYFFIFILFIYLFIFSFLLVVYEGHVEYHSWNCIIVLE